MPVTGPECCPACGADLRTVTPPGRCPDCGLEFDQHTHIWRSHRTWHHYAVFYGLIGLGAGLFVAIAYRLGHGEVPNPLLPVLTAVGVAAVGLIMQRVLNGRLSGRFVALTPAGILVGTRPRSLMIPWEDVRRLSTRHHIPRIERHGTSFAEPLEDVFDNAAELAEFAQALKEARKRDA